MIKKVPMNYWRLNEQTFIKDLIRHRRWKKQQKKYQKEENES